jgi:hypothetical protein
MASQWYSGSGFFGSRRLEENSTRIRGGDDNDDDDNDDGNADDPDAS